MMVSRMRDLLSCAFATLVLSAATTATAADDAPIRNQIYLVPSITFMGEDEEIDVNGYAMPGIGIGANITDRLALEFHYAESETDLQGFGNTDVDIESLRMDAIFDFGGDTWKIYGVGGVGSLEYEAAGIDEQNLLLNLGMGVMRSVTDRLALRGDARMVYLNESEELVPAATVALRYVFSGPTTRAPRDADGDGVVDGNDRCPGTAPGVNVDMTGCPSDVDGDGVLDGADACPRTPAGVAVDSRGCALDTDGDGVADHVDACPATPRGTRVDARGCTVKPPEPTKVRIELNIEFDFDSAMLRPEHALEVDRVASFMRAHPRSVAEIRGHTDDRGAAAYNQGLSERRAKAVMQDLITRGRIAANRITAIGLGETMPISSNDTVDGRDRNRRVTARIEAME